MNQLQRYIPLLENYLRAKDKTKFVESVTDNTEKTLMQCLTKSLSTINLRLLKEKLSHLNLSNQIQAPLIEYKLIDYLRKQEKIQDSDEIIAQIERRFCGNNFHYNQPHSVQNQNQHTAQKKKENCELKVESAEQYIKRKMKNDSSFIRKLEDCSISQLSLKQLSSIPLFQQAACLERSNILFTYKANELVQYLLKFEKEMRKQKKNDSYKISQKVLSALTKEQIIKLGEKNPSLFDQSKYIELWLNHKYVQEMKPYVEKVKEMTEKDKKQKKQYLLKVIQELQTKKDRPAIKSYINKFKQECIFLDIELKETNLQDFQEYLNNTKPNNCFKNQFVQHYHQNQRNSHPNNYDSNFRYRLEADNVSSETIIEKYLDGLFHQSKSREEASSIILRLSRFFEEKYLRVLYCTAKLRKGDQVEGIENYFDAKQLQELSDKREINILGNNKRNFKEDDVVELDITVKNTPELQVKIYEMNMEKHIVETHTEIDEEVNLSFIKPSIQFTEKCDCSNRHKVVQKKIDLKCLGNRMGVFIIELQGQAVSSRAFIRKGSILFLQTIDEAGYNYQFFDEKGNQLKANTQNERQGLVVWGRMKKQQIINGKVTFPFTLDTQYVHIVACYKGYAQQFSQNIGTQTYKLEVGYVYNHESFLTGKKAKILVYPKIRLNEKIASVDLLKKAKIKVTLTNFQDIKTFFTFQNIKFSDNKEEVIEFPIQAYLKKIEINVQGEVPLYSNKTQTLKSNKVINIDLGENKSNFIDLYLDKRGKKGYVLNVLGMNGEKISNADINICYNYANIGQVQRANLQTNNEGKIFLGELADISKLSAEINSNQCSVQRVWTINDFESYFNYTKTRICRLNSSHSLPIVDSWKSSIFLARTYDKFYCENLTDKLVFKNGRVYLPKLDHEGVYILKVLPLERNLEYEVIDTPWKQNQNPEKDLIFDPADYIITEANVNLYHNISIFDAKFKTEGEHINAKINVDLEGIPQKFHKNIRVHVIANNYVKSDINDVFKADSYCVAPKMKNHYTKKRYSSYYSNKMLGEEGAYVLKRQKQDKMVGNNLQKPCLFLKKTLVKQTEQKEQDLYEMGDYMAECAIIDMNPNLRRKMPLSNATTVRSLNNSRTIQSITTHNSFLKYSGEISYNLPVNELTFKIPKNYSNIQVYILTPSSAIKRQFNIQQAGSAQIKDLRHAGISDKKPQTGLTISREAYKLSSKESNLVNRDSQWRTIGLTDIFSYANTKKIQLYSWNEHLLNWQTYSESKKKQIYDKQCCHELNTFIKFKDEKFFHNVVQKFIKDKLNKNIVDLCLLEDDRLLEFIKIQKLQKLNEFEKTLLVHGLKKKGKENEAQVIVQSMQLRQKGIKISFEQYKRCFDTIINAKQDQKVKERIRQMRRCDQRMRQQSQEEDECCDMGALYDGEGGAEESRSYSRSPVYMRQQVMQKKKAFVPIESTKQYTERTYYNVKDYNKEAKYLVGQSPFWAQLARHLLTNPAKTFLSKSFMYLSTAVEYMLASSFVSSQSATNFELENKDNQYQITAQSPFLLYVKEIKALEFKNKFGVMMNQRFFDPKNKYIYEEDGTEVERQVEEFIINKPYNIQTVVTNTSGTPLELQVLLDIPKGAVPLRSHEYTQIISINISPYSTKSFERQFYFPQEGKFETYPANACRGQLIISKAKPMDFIQVKKVLTINKLESFSDIIRSGKQDQILKFMKSSNIFDGKVFNSYDILWMLKDKKFYKSTMEILRSRNYYNKDIATFAFFHKDLETMKEYIFHQVENKMMLPIFEYFPYYSSRTHKFANQSKTTIRNVQLKDTYYKFLISAAIDQNCTSEFEIAFAYYMILQDRLIQARQMINSISENAKKNHQIQLDYMRCFLDVSLNSPNFNVSFEIVKKYVDYPVESWKKLFDEVRKTLQKNEQIAIFDEKITGDFQTKVIVDGNQIRIMIPENIEIEIEGYDLDLELYFSQRPFDQGQTYTPTKAEKIERYQRSKKSREVVFQRKNMKKNMQDVMISVNEIKEGCHPDQVKAFFWTNPDIKVKINENEGNLQVYLGKKRTPGCYVKVFSNGKRYKFYRDGYTDMTGTFRYALADLDGIKEFAILVVTQIGGVMHTIKPPSRSASF